MVIPKDWETEGSKSMGIVHIYLKGNQDDGDFDGCFIWSKSEKTFSRNLRHGIQCSFLNELPVPQLPQFPTHD